jgi:hypothetical protein
MGLPARKDEEPKLNLREWLKLPKVRAALAEGRRQQEKQQKEDAEQLKNKTDAELMQMFQANYTSPCEQDYWHCRARQEQKRREWEKKQRDPRWVADRAMLMHLANMQVKLRRRF